MNAGIDGQQQTEEQNQVFFIYYLYIYTYFRLFVTLAEPRTTSDPDTTMP